MEEKGFTLVELMITVAILGILVAIAVPAYQEYVIRTRVADGLHLASSAELAVAEYSFNANALPSTQAETGFQFTVGTPGVSSIAIGAGGVITITFNQMAGNGTVLLTPTIEASGVLTWDCIGGTLIPDYRPANCRP